MANIRTGSIVSDIRGKVGSEIYSRNRGGAYVKAYAAPVQPGSSIQLQAQNGFKNAVDAWTALPDAEKQLWDNVANSMDTANKVAIRAKKSGRNEYIRRKFLKDQYWGGGPLLPIIPAVEFSMSVNWTTPSSTSLVYTVSSNVVSSDWYWFYKLSDQLSPSIRSRNSTRTVHVAIDSVVNGTTFDIYSFWNGVWASGPMVNGNRVFADIALWHEPSGYLMAYNPFNFLISF